MSENAASQNIVFSSFVPMLGMQNRHLMTILASQWVRRFPSLLDTQKQKIIEVDPKASVLVECNYADDFAATNDHGRGRSAPEPGGNGRSIAIIVHGLEGSSRSHYVMGVAEKFLANGISAARMNMRNCGGTMHLSRTLYNAGLSADLQPVAEHFLSEGFENIFFVGFSLGGNVVLKAASEISLRQKKYLKGVCAVSPSLDLHACVTALEQWFNRIYEMNFLRSLKAKIVEKNRLQPGKYDLSFLPGIKTVRGFDDIYTAPDGGYSSAGDYYSRASSLQMLPDIHMPVLIITAQDDPFVPFASFQAKEMKGSHITLLAPIYGGHAGFLGARVEKPDQNFSNGERNLSSGNESLNLSSAKTAPPAVAMTDRFWAEKSCVEFCQRLV